MRRETKKFDTLLENTLYRYQQGGLLTGELVKIKPDALKCEKIKGMTEAYKGAIENAMKTDLNLRLASVKSIRPNTTQNYNEEGTDAPADFWCDIVIEYAPGLWRDPITVPMDILERVDNGINLAPVPDSLRYNDQVKVKPKEVEAMDQARKLPTKDTKMDYTSKPKDGRDGLSLESVYANLVKKNKANVYTVTVGDVFSNNVALFFMENDINYKDTKKGSQRIFEIATPRTEKEITEMLKRNVLGDMSFLVVKKKLNQIEEGSILNQF